MQNSAHQADRAGGDDEKGLVEALRRGEEGAFAALIDRYHGPLTRFARLHLGDPEAVRDVVQETWLAVLAGIHRFEGRSSLGTWLFSILVKRAYRRSRRDRRTTTFSESWSADGEGWHGAVSPECFLTDDHPRWPGHWASPPTPWEPLAERELLGREAFAVAREAIRNLPPAQREVIVLCDVEGLPSAEVCDALGVSASNQRVLLHRARSKVRAALDGFYRRGGSG